MKRQKLDAHRTAARAVLCALALVASAQSSATAQATRDGGADKPWYVSVSQWGRWGALASAVGFTALAVIRNNDANEVFRGLLVLCSNASQACVPGADGSYVDPGAETLYQETLRLDGRARTWMTLGQISLVAAGGMFLVNLVSGQTEPNNIPFAPLELVAGPRKLGLKVRF